MTRPARPDIDAILTRAAAEEPRIRVQRLAERRGISGASNAALAQATQDYVTFLDHDDTLAPHALAAMAHVLAEEPATDLAFSDEDQLIDGKRAAPYVKPGWNPDLMLSQNLVCHLAVYRASLVRSLGGLRSAFDGSQDYDLALRRRGRPAPSSATCRMCSIIGANRPGPTPPPLRRRAAMPHAAPWPRR